MPTQPNGTAGDAFESMQHTARRAKRPLLYLLSPVSFAVFVALVLALTAIENPIGWASTYSYFDGVTPSIGLSYLGVFLVTAVIVRVTMRLSFASDATRAAQKPLEVNPKLAFCLLGVAMVFQIAKFVNIGSIPLFGDPLSRYKLTLGGLEDYPSRLIAPLSTALFSLLIFGKPSNRGLKKGAILAGLFLNALLTQRQEIANVVFGCGLVAACNRAMRPRVIISFAVLAFVAVYTVVGLGAVVRFGAETISAAVPTLMLPIWIVHAEVTVPYVFGEHVIALLNGNMLYGLYTFGEFFSIFSSDKLLHGASLMQRLFTAKETAQSIGAPYSYFLDFGYAGLVGIGFVNASIMTFFYRQALTNRKSTFWITAYSIVFLAAFWSVRSGISIFYPLGIYNLVALFCLTRGGSRLTSQLRSVARFCFILSLLASVSALAFRH